MGATQKDRSGIFDAACKGKPARKAAVLDQQFHLGPRGITFVTDTYLPEWTEVGVEMKLPHRGAGPQRQIDCHGVVVQCMRRERGGGFEIALLFLDLPKGAYAHLPAADSATPTSISISR